MHKTPAEQAYAENVKQTLVAVGFPCVSFAEGRLPQGRHKTPLSSVTPDRQIQSCHATTKGQQGQQ